MDAIVCTGELGQGCAKPSTIPFEVALTLLDVAPQTTAYIADDISKDFAGPNQLGMKTVQIRSAGLLGVREKPVPSKAVYQPHLAADSLPEALILLGLL
jgi:FMN phosphatase YigB (HAD superfamily)